MVKPAQSVGKDVVVGTQVVYDLVLEVLEKGDFWKDEVICGLLTIIATQYTDRIIEGDELHDFLDHTVRFIDLYWKTQGGVKH